jgi:DNA-binding transcriptional LysR family regulator
LEEYYGVKLFEFTGRKFRLSRYGELIRDNLTLLNNNEKYIMERISDLKDKKKTINMGATLTVGEFMLTDYLALYMKKNPKADISVSVSNTEKLLNDLKEGILDFAVIEGNFSEIYYNYIEVLESDFCGVCGGETALAEQGSLNLSELLGMRLFLREKGSGTRDIFEKVLNENKLMFSDFSSVTTIGNMNAIVDLVALGCGITFLYEKAAEEKISKKEIVKINIKGFPIKHRISAIWRKDNLQGKYIEGIIKDFFEVGQQSDLF